MWPWFGLYSCIGPAPPISQVQIQGSHWGDRNLPWCNGMNVPLLLGGSCPLQCCVGYRAGTPACLLQHSIGLLSHHFCIPQNSLTVNASSPLAFVGGCAHFGDMGGHVFLIEVFSSKCIRCGWHTDLFRILRRHVRESLANKGSQAYAYKRSKMYISYLPTAVMSLQLPCAQPIRF